MTFQPSMTSTHEGVTVLEPLRWRRWNGVVADLWHAACGPQARGHYVSAHPRLFIVLETEGGSFETRLKPHGDDLRGVGGRGSINFVPAHLPLWGGVEAPMRLRHLDLHFDPEALCEQICERLSARQMAKPRLMFDDPHLFALAGLIAREVTEPDARHDLYGDSLILALLIDLFGVERREPSRGSTLSSWQLRRVTDYITEHCNGSIRLQDLAKLARAVAILFQPCLQGLDRCAAAPMADSGTHPERPGDAARRATLPDRDCDRGGFLRPGAFHARLPSRDRRDAGRLAPDHARFRRRWLNPRGCWG
jgi:AraC family transcriptional regulator